MPSAAEDWVAGLSPWPEEFGLERMRALLTRLGDPQRGYPSIHVVGSNGKSTAVRTIEELLRAEGLRVSAYLSPHVSGWSERIRVDGEEADFEAAVGRIRPVAEELGATQFEALTAAALTAFAEADVDVAVVEAGLGGRLDATNVVDAPVVLLTNVELEHTDVLGHTTEEIAREKLAVAHAAKVVVASDNTYERLVPPSASLVVGGAREAAEAFVGREVAAEVDVALPGRFEVRNDDPLEIWDGAHTREAMAWLTNRLPPRSWISVVSILADKDVDAILWGLSVVAKRLVATQSSNPRALGADELARAARALPRHETAFADVQVEPDPVRALERARDQAGPRGGVLVTGSLYLLADLWSRQGQRVA
jgi:dihydrofolate synthase / folylpolyglutamate synthase